MQSGNLDRQIDIQQVVHARGSDGGDDLSWNTLYSAVPCQAIPMKATERFSSLMIRESKVYRFIIRYGLTVQSDYRVVYLAQNYRIIGLAEIGRQTGLEITAELLQGGGEA